MLYKLVELDVTDPELEKKIQEYAKLSDLIDSKAAELRQLQRQFSEIDVDLRGLVESLTDASDRVLRTQDILITIKKAGYDRTDSSYKSAYELLMTKVNGKIKAIAQDCLDATKTITHVSSKLAVQRSEGLSLSEAMFSNITDKLSTFFRNIINKLTNKINSIDIDLDRIESML